MTTLFRLKNPFYRKAFSKSLVNTLAGYSNFLRPFHQGKSFSLVCDLMNISSIGSLFHSTGPATVIRFVISRCINSVKRHVLRRLTHVQKEVFKLVPSLAHNNSSATVILVILCVFVVTPFVHARPNPINQGLSHSVGFRSIPDCFSACFASARNGVPVPDIFGGYFLHASAITEPTPFRTTVRSRMRFLDGSQVPEFIARAKRVSYFHSVIMRRLNSKRNGDNK